MSQQTLPKILTTHIIGKNPLTVVKDLSFEPLVSRIQQQIDPPLALVAYRQKQLHYEVINGRASVKRCLNTELALLDVEIMTGLSN